MGGLSANSNPYQANLYTSFKTWLRKYLLLAQRVRGNVSSGSQDVLRKTHAGFTLQIRSRKRTDGIISV